MEKRIGLVAGSGKFPLIVAQAARKKGIKVFAIAIKEEANPLLNKHSDKILWLSIGELNKIVNAFAKENIRDVFMAGKIKKTLMFSNIKFDPTLKRLLNTLEIRNDNSLLLAFVSELKKQGIYVRNSLEYIPDLLADSGVLNNIKPDESTLEDIRFGFKMAKHIAGLDIGQTVVVKHKAILAVEAIEGTDRAILRGGELGKGNIVVAKVAKPNQDLRFDVPVVGMETLKTLKKVNAQAIVLETNKTIILDKHEFLKETQLSGISVIGLKSETDPI